MTPHEAKTAGDWPSEAAKRALISALARRIVSGYLREMAEQDQLDSVGRTNHAPLQPMRPAA